MRTLATKQPTHDSAKEKKNGDRVRSSRHFSPLATGMPLLQRQCACGGGCPRCQEQALLQTKLKISEPGDQYEQEADRVADEVMQMPEPSVQRQIEAEEEEDEMVQRKATSSPAQESDVPQIVYNVLRSSGQPLDPATRTFMESRFGTNFSQVQIHTETQAAASAQAVNAKAYTVGANIVFDTGQYQPHSQDGKRLIAHELTHIVQQQEASKRSVSKLPAIQRIVNVSPSSAGSDILSQFDFMCPGQFNLSGSRINSTCKASTTRSCDCLCDVASDPARTYSINVQPAAGSSTQETLYDGSIPVIPTSSLWPNTVRGTNPTISVPDSSTSTIEFGAFKPDGRPVWYNNWRILAHELCGHGRANQTYTGGRGNRATHDVTIDTENDIAAEHGEPARGHFAAPRQGEAFYNPIGDRSKVVFYQVNGTHYEAP